MTKAKRTQEERVYGPIDYLLTGVYVCLAVYSAGIAVGSPPVAWTFCGLVAAGTTFSFFMQSLVGTRPIAKIDGYLYMLAGSAAIFFGGDLVQMLPENPFERQLVVAGAFCFFLCFGSFFTWRDGTLLFQAVPSIALFGMVGVFDTFANAIWLFYLFIVALATMFARAHRRAMIAQATASGYKAMLAAEEKSRGVSSRGESALLRAFNTGPWRWMAGPEWALASALVVILVTMIGAPVVREMVKPISGFAKIQPPRGVRPQSIPQLFRSGPNDGEVEIGLGPLNLSERPVARVRMDSLDYLRGRTFDHYDDRRGWDSRMYNSGDNSIAAISVAEISQPVRSEFWSELLDPNLGFVPIPGHLLNRDEIRERYSLRVRGDGTISVDRRSNAVPRVEGEVVNPDIMSSTPSATEDLPGAYNRAYLDTRSVSERVQNWAKEQAVGSTDWERATELKRAIERTALYNLRAAPIPSDSEPIEHFLFVSKEGYCDLFASSMVMTARSIGIPARYVTGFFPMSNVRDPNDPKVWTLQERDAHSWAELYFDGYGWVVFDATEGAIQAPEGERGQATVGQPFWQQDWFGSAINIAIGALIVVGGGIMLAAYIRRRNNPVVTAKEIGHEYGRFVRVIERASGRRRSLSDTPDEFLEMAEAWLGGSFADAKTLNQKFVRALYAKEPLTPDIIRDLRSGTDEFRRSLKSNPPERPNKK